MKGKDLTSLANSLQSRVSLWLRRSSIWLLPVTLGALYFLYGFSQIHEYGVTWDEPLHRNWGKIFVFFWKTGDRRLLELMPGHGIAYGPLYYALNYLFSEWVYGHGWLRFVEANHLLTLFTASVAVGLTAVLGRIIGGLRVAFLSALTIVLYPQLLAHAQYNPKDIPLMTAVLLTAIFFVAALKRSSPKLFLLSALLMGAAVAAKVSALLMAPIFGSTYLFWLLLDVRAISLRSVFTQVWLIGGSVLLFLLGAYIFWPSAWEDPLLIGRSIQFFLSSTFWPGKVLYFGTQYAGADLPWHYTVFEFFAATPILLLLPFLAGLLLMLRRIRASSDQTASLFLLLWVLFPIAYSMRPGFVRYDGIRQFFFLLPAASVIAGLGLGKVFDFVKQHFQRSWIVPVLVVFLCLNLGYEISVAHPFEGSYRNEVIRTLYASGMDHVFEIEYWGASYRQGMDWLVQNADPNPVICVPTAGVLVEWYAWRSDFSFGCESDADYVMFFTRYSEAGEFAKLREPVFTIKRMGADLLNIYRLKS